MEIFYPENPAKKRSLLNNNFSISAGLTQGDMTNRFHYGFHQKIGACKLHGTCSNTSLARFIVILENMFRFTTVFSVK
jgi:hypothetical protein